MRIDDGKIVFSTHCKEKVTIAVCFADAMITEYGRPIMVVTADSGIDITKDNTFITSWYARIIADRSSYNASFIASVYCIME